MVFWKLWEKEDKKTGEKETLPVLRHYTVFNAAAQCEGLELPSPLPVEDRPPFEPVLAASPPERGGRVVHGGGLGVLRPRPPVEAWADTSLRLWRYGTYGYGWKDAGRPPERIEDFQLDLGG